MSSTYRFLFRKPWIEDKAYLAYLVLIFLAMLNGGFTITNFMLYGFGLYLFPMVPLLIVRRIIARDTSSDIANRRSENLQSKSGTMILPVQKPPKISDLMLLDGDDVHEVVGESSYQINFARLIGEEYEDEVEVIATLQAQPDNKFDKDAIGVFIDGLMVGFIPKDQTYKWHPLLADAEKSEKYLAAKGRLWWRNDSTENQLDIFASVSLFVDEDNFAVKVNSLPVSNSVRLLPAKVTAKVSISSAGRGRLMELLELAKPSSTAWFYARLDLVDYASRPSIELSVGDCVIGSLSSVTTAKLAETLQILREHGKELFVVCSARGNALSVEVLMHFTSPENLTDDQVEQILS